MFWNNHREILCTLLKSDGPHFSRSRYFPEEKYKTEFCKLNYRVSGEPREEHSSRTLHVKWGKRAV